MPNDNPDPTYYNANTRIVKAAYPNYSMGSKYPSIMEDTDCNPGPGHYNNPEITLSSTLSKKSKFGTQPRFSEPNIRSPGPADYNLGKLLTFVTNKGKLSQSKRSMS